MSRNGSATLHTAPPVHPALAIGAVAAGTLAMTVAARYIGPHVPLRATIAVGTVLLAVPALLLLFFAKRPLAQALALRAVDRRTVVLSVLLGLTLWVASAGLLQLQFALWPPPPLYFDLFRQIHDALRPANPLDALVSVLVIAVAPAIFEELLLRGVVLPSLLPVLGGTWAVLASAVIFAAIHVDPYRFLFTLSVGAALGWARLSTQSLVPCMLAHGVLNCLTFVAAPLVDDPSQITPDASPLAGAALLLLGAPPALAVLRRLSRGGECSER